LDIMHTIEQSLALAWNDWTVRIEIDAPADDVKLYLPRHFAIVESIDEMHCIVRASTSDLEWFAWRIARIPHPMTVLEPAELRDVFRQHAARLIAIAERATNVTETPSS